MNAINSEQPESGATTVWTIDSHSSQAEFVIGSRLALVRRSAIGRFDEVAGTLLLNEEQPTRSSIELTIRTASIATGNGRRDLHLRTPDFFDVSRRPSITFISRVVTLADARANRYRVTGDLTIRDVTRTESFDVLYAPSPLQWGRPVTRFAAKGTINRRDFGLVWSSPLISVADDVRISLNLVAIAALGLAA